ncbi:SdrD B-like domain-containing protein [Bacillus cereus]|uniref:SD-repeat containing protein B domain-containing protein n=1 Tax=Bacillus cereus TaxID=1396 RepID=A0A2A8ZST8_BACCE|nr:SdrD B-like domain-containing protein [Bacillus cereus]PFE09035.1 hypothetical protein CN307_27010 [Bacillus cereus]
MLDKEETIHAISEVGTITAFVFEIVNGQEIGIEDVVVNLYKWNLGRVDHIADEVTHNSGQINFTGLSDGEYYLKITAPNNYKVFMGDFGSDDGGRTGTTGFQQVTTNQPNNVRSIFSPLGKEIGGRAWNDANQNGSQDAGETGITNIPVQLYTRSGVHIASTQTDSTGSYLFRNNLSGEYYVHIDIPEGMKIVEGTGGIFAQMGIVSTSK